MANEYTVTGEDLTGVADAIRTKGGTTDQLVFPDGFVAAIQEISSGGVNVQTKSGTLTVSDGYEFIVDCGFAPDAIIFTLYESTVADSPFVLYAGCRFKYTTCFIVASDPYNSVEYAMTVYQESTGFSIVIGMYGFPDLSESVSGYYNIEYYAIKYT